MASIVLLWSIVAAGQSGTLAPNAKFTGFDADGNPLPGGKLCTYEAGTTTPKATYTNASLAVANTNPVILDAAGRADVWLTPGQAYKFILREAGSDATCNTGSTQWTVDNIGAVPTSSNNTDVLGTAGEAIAAGLAVYLSDGSGGKTVGQWYTADATNAYSSAGALLGMAPNAVAAGAVGTMRLGGQVTGLSSLTVGASYFVSSTPGALTTTAPVVNRRFVGLADSTSSLILGRSPSTRETIPLTVVASTATGTQNDWAPGLVGHTVVVLNNASALTITGLAGGFDGQVVTFLARNALVTFAHNSGSSAVANRFINLAQSAPTPIMGNGSNAGGYATYVYNGANSVWQLIDHDQGAWIAPTFSAFDFTGNAPMTWSVESGDVATMKYRLVGKTLTVTFRILTTTVGGTPATTLQINNGQWGGFTATDDVQSLSLRKSDNSATTSTTPGIVQSNGTLIALFVDGTATATWTASTNLTSVLGTLTFQVN